MVQYPDIFFKILDIQIHSACKFQCLSLKKSAHYFKFLKVQFSNTQSSPGCQTAFLCVFGYLPLAQVALYNNVLKTRFQKVPGFRNFFHTHVKSDTPQKKVLKKYSSKGLVINSQEIILLRLPHSFAFAIRLNIGNWLGSGMVQWSPSLLAGSGVQILLRAPLLVLFFVFIITCVQ